MSWIQTYTGRRFDPLNPDPEQIAIEDIAHALGNICRFTGHTREFYSVAQHSVLLSQQLTGVLARVALLHDASEAYLCDLAKPVKESPAFQNYCMIEEVLQHAIFHRFGLAHALATAIKADDFRMLVTEAQQLMQPLHPDWAPTLALADPFRIMIDPWPPRASRAMFMAAYRDLFHAD